jgi:hypothetical protein
MNTKPWTAKPWDIRASLVLNAYPMAIIPFFDFCSSNAGEPGRPKGRKFGDDPRYKVRKKKRSH